MEKAALRERVLAEVRALPAEGRAVRSAQIREAVVAELGECGDATVLVFAGLAGEPDLVPLLGSPWCTALDGGGLVFPRVAGAGSLTLHRVSDRSLLEAGTFGVREPDISRCPEVQAGAIDVALVPGVAFDPRSGVRLGRGGGYYDRLLGSPGFRARTVGVCFSPQVVDGVPCAPHDRSVSAVLTEDGVIVRPGG